MQPFPLFAFPEIFLMSADNIIGNYRIGECIGRGGMGIVYRGEHLQLPREVAIKSINARESRDLRKLRARFEKEAYVQSQLDHPGIVKIYDYIVSEQTYYIVMELVEGRSLAQLLAHEERPLSVEHALRLFEQMLEAIAYAQDFTYRDQNGMLHRGLIHRDLKPGNILVTPEDRVKITDFGIVKLIGSENSDTFGTFYGSPQYVSPEQAEGLPVDERSDTYSLGIILYEMLTGAPPFDNEEAPLSRTETLRAHVEKQPRPPSEVNPAVTPEIEALVLRALEKKPERRFASADDFLHAVRELRARLSGEESPEKSAAAIRASRGEKSGTGRTARSTGRENYITQPLTSASSCPSCGAEISDGDKQCPECGRETGTSPATARLTHIESVVAQRTRRRVLWLLAGLCLLTLFGFLFYRARQDGRSPNPPPAPVAVVTPAPTPVPPSALTELKPTGVKVDSSYDGYNAAPLTDGETDVRRIARMKYNAGNWASAETPEAHWIELTFQQPARIAAVYVYWGFDRNRFVPSRRVEMQTPDESGAWRTISTLQSGDDHDHAAFEFAPLSTQKIRLLQPAQQGPPNRPFVMWVREVKVFEVN
jgi:serine/threonine-protein kinase